MDGRESTRPVGRRRGWAERRRVVPAIQGLRARAPVSSVDATKESPRRPRRGGDVVNDVSGLRFDPAGSLVAERKCPS